MDLVLSLKKRYFINVFAVRLFGVLVGFGEMHCCLSSSTYKKEHVKSIKLYYSKENSKY